MASAPVNRPSHTPNFFAGAYIDRRAEARESPSWFDEALSDPTTLYVISHGTTQLVFMEPQPRIAYLTAEHPVVRLARREQLVLLGWIGGVRCVLVEVESTEVTTFVPGGRFEELRPLSGLLPAEEAGVLAYARAMAIWRSRHRYCGTCGAPTQPERAGHVMRCSNPACGTDHFPRVDPAIIVLVDDGERALLGRQASWPKGRYSTIAGFVEPGESLEDAVVREVMEETGVPVSSVRYHSSQPWPFPSSLMVGFHAKAEPGTPVVVGCELEHARWFTREEILSGTPSLPPAHTISHRLISAWLQE